jgi:hypothetical protein
MVTCPVCDREAADERHLSGHVVEEHMTKATNFGWVVCWCGLDVVVDRTWMAADCPPCVKHDGGWKTHWIKSSLGICGRYNPHLLNGG